MHKIYELKEKLCKELEEYADKDKLDVSSVSIIDTLAHTIKNLDKIIEKYEEKEYSESGGSYSYGPVRRYVDGGYRYPRMDGYSRAEERVDSMIMDLQDMVRDLPPNKQHEVKKFIQGIEMTGRRG